MLLTACQSLCTTLETALGPQVVEWISFAAAIAYTWWRTRRVDKAAQAGIAAARADAAEARLSLARIEGSLRPVAPTAADSLAPTLPPLVRGNTPSPAPPELVGNEGGTSRSGTYQPVVWPELDASTPKPRPSMPEPNLVDPQFPRPSAVPSDNGDGKGATGGK